MNTTIQRKTTTLPLLIAIALLLVHWTAVADSSTNTSYGIGALPGNTGSANSAFGYGVLNRNGSGNNNTGVGAYAIRQIFSGNDNTAPLQERSTVCRPRTL